MPHHPGATPRDVVSGLRDHLRRHGTLAPGVAASAVARIAAGLAEKPEPDNHPDVYALGALLYELVTGHPPHPATPAPPSGRVPVAMWAVMASCLQREPRLRPAAAELARSLTGVADSIMDDVRAPAPRRRNQPASWRWARPRARE